MQCAATGYEGAESALDKITKPKDIEVKELSKVFHYYQSKPGPSRTFDPRAKCVVAENQRKKKASVPNKKGKTSSGTVVVLDKYTSNVPRGKARQKLATSGKMQSVLYTRDMSSVQVETKIKSVFNLSDYTVLESDSSGHTYVNALTKSWMEKLLHGRRSRGGWGGLSPPTFSL